MLFCQCFGIAVYQNGKTVFVHHKDTAKFDRYKKNEKNFTKPTYRHPFARLATVSRAPVGFPPHPPSLSLVFRFFHSSAYARVFSFPLFFNRSNPILSYFSFTSLFLIGVTTISFHPFSLNRITPTKKESLKVIVLRKEIEGNSYCRNCLSGTIVIRKLYVFYIIYVITTECWEKGKM